MPVTFLPKALFTTNKEAKFTAGPAIRKTKAAPGVNPFNISAAAMGMEPVAQTYIGMANSKTANISSNGLSAKETSQDSGNATEISAAITKPVIMCPPMSCIISTNPYRRARIIFLQHPS